MPLHSSEALEAARKSPETSLRTGQGSAVRGILLNGGLGAAKLAAGLLGHSYALVADAAESFADVMGSCVTLYGLRIAAEPADQTHPAGHGRAETLASAVTALALIGVGVLIFTHALASLGEPRVGPNPLTLLVLVPVIIVKERMFHWMRARGKEIGSLAVLSDAWHQRSDVVTSVAALTGIIMAWVGGPAWSHADSWAAMLASVWLMGTGLWLLGPTLHELMEGSVDPALLDFIRETSQECEGIKGIDKVWVRKLGMRLMIDMHIVVDPDISVQEGHRLAHEVKARLQRELPQVRDVMVHVEPYEEGRPKQPYRIQSGGEAVSAFPPDYVRAHLLALGCDLARVEETFIHSGGAGGQNVNKVATCVQLRYPPKNILLKMQEHRTQASNRLAAWKLLAQQLQRAKEELERARRMARELKRRQNASRPRGVKRQFVELKRRRAKIRGERGNVGDED